MMNGIHRNWLQQLDPVQLEPFAHLVLTVPVLLIGPTKRLLELASTKALGANGITPMLLQKMSFYPVILDF